MEDSFVLFVRGQRGREEAVPAVVKREGFEDGD